MESILDVQFEMANALATALLHALWQCALLAVVAAVTLQMLSRHSSALRHTVGMGFLLAMAGVPAWTFVKYWFQPVDGADHLVSPAAMVPEADTVANALLQPSGGWSGLVCALWFFGFLYILIRHLGGLWWIGRLERREAGRLPAEWQTRLQALQTTMGITREIVVRVSENVLAPFTARLFQPVIWMPLSLLLRMPREQIEALLAHELAHIHRLDWLWNGVQCFVEALLFFHPGVWWLSRRIREEREQACDDAAVYACTDGVALSEALAALARDRQVRPRLLLAANEGPLMRRIARLLAGAPAPARSGALPVLVALLAAGAVLAAPFGVGYAAPSHPAEPAGSVSSPSGLHGGLAVSPVTTKYAATRDAAQASRDVAARAERAAQDQAAHALGVGRAVQATDTETPPHVERPVAPVPGFTGRTGFLPVSAEAAASPTGQASQALVRLVAADPRVASRIGTPLAVSSDGFTGSWRRDEDAGIYTEVRLSFELTGPQGRARIWASAMQNGGQWRLTGMRVHEFTPPQ